MDQFDRNLCNYFDEASITPMKRRHSRHKRRTLNQIMAVHDKHLLNTSKYQQFCNLIRIGNFPFVQSSICSNIGYLVNKFDMPPILKKRDRHNALHIAVIYNRASICDLILRTISNPDNLRDLYSNCPDSTYNALSGALLDAYLNIPEITLDNTPIHLAVSWGYYDIVKILVSYPQLKMTCNKLGLLPKDVICKCVPKNFALIARIKDLLSDKYFVPVYRESNANLMPMIGEIVCSRSPLGSMFNNNLCENSFQLCAFAGPMNESTAQQFCKEWKTYDRSSYKANHKNPDPRLTDFNKGLEKVGRKLAAMYNVEFKEYWPFMDTFLDLTSPSSLVLFEEYMKQRFEKLFPPQEVNSCEFAHIDKMKVPCYPKTADIINNTISCVDKSIKVFANRLSRIIFKGTIQGNFMESFKNEINQFHGMINSFRKEDCYSHINFHCVHAKLSKQTANYLKKFNLIVGQDISIQIQNTEILLKSLVPTINKSDNALLKLKFKIEKDKKLCCIINSLQIFLQEDFIWFNNVKCTNEIIGACFCYYKSGRKYTRNGETHLSEFTLCNYNDQFFMLNENESDSDTNDFEETREGGVDVFIIDSYPTNLDYEVFEILCNLHVSQQNHPHIYRWKHNMQHWKNM